MSGGRVRLRSDARGTASIEIVVMLPLFVLLLLAVYHLHTSGTAALLAAEQSRGCAFQYAVTGCAGVDGLELCKGAYASKGADVKRESDARNRAGDELNRELDRNESILDKVEDIPVLGGLVRMLFGEGALASSEREAPRFMGRESLALRSTYYVVCNTVSKSWEDLMRDQVCAVVTGQLGLKGRVLGCK